MPARHEHHSGSRAVNQAESIIGSLPRRTGLDTSAPTSDSDSRRGREASLRGGVADVASPAAWAASPPSLHFEGADTGAARSTFAMHRTEATRSEPPTTLLESFDSWAQLLRNGEPPEAIPTAAPATRNAAAAPDAKPFRPILRRPLALLHVIDDGREDGETIRLRSDRLLIGRTDGDVTIPHDITMSTRHALLEYEAGSGWQLSDVGSAGGTFVRVLSARLHDGSSLQLGATRFRFDAGAEPCLVELEPDGEGARHLCRNAIVTIGTVGSGCDIGIADSFISHVHAELRQTPGGWRIENRGLNGLWVRITGPIKLAHPSQFQCGEQRFVFEPLTG